ncbi:unnamed protein product [Lathyrus oleraceus]
MTKGAGSLPEDQKGLSMKIFPPISCLKV